jgi:hypothetical protein
MSGTDGTWVRLRDDLWRRKTPDMESVRESLWDAVFAATEAGCDMWDAVFAATEAGCDIYWFGDDRCLLDFAIRDGLPGVVQRLMAMGVNPAKRDGNGWNAMHFAAKICPFAETFMVLPVELMTGRSSWGSTPLHIAVQNLNVQAVQWMLEQPCCPVEAKSGIGTAFDSLWEMDSSPEAVAIRAAFAARQRWTPLRAAWVGSVITYAK